MYNIPGSKTHQLKTACSTSRNTGTRNKGTPEHPGTSQNISEHPKKKRNTP